MRFKKNQRGQTYRSGWRSSAGGHWTYHSSDQSPGPVDAVRSIPERGGKEIDQPGRRSPGEIGSWLEKPLVPTEKKFRKELTNPCDYWKEKAQQQIQWQEELEGMLQDKEMQEPGGDSSPSCWSQAAPGEMMFVENTTKSTWSRKRRRWNRWPKHIPK